MALSPAEQAIVDKIDEGQLLELTRSLLRATGENPPGEEAATVAVLTDAATRLGLDVCETPVQPGRNNVRVTLPGGTGPGLLLLGHTDVVPVGGGWTRDPFGADVEAGRIYGRGAADMKGGLAASLMAMAALRDAGLSGPVVLAALIDEEETGAGIRSYVSAAPEGSFVGCITAEPTDLQTIIGARGACNLRIDILGTACHAGHPEDGANAIYGAAAVVAEIQRLHRVLAQQSHPLLGPATWSVGQIYGGTGAAIVAADCVTIADRRLLPDESAAVVLDDLRERIAELGLRECGLRAEVTMLMDMPAFETAAESPLAAMVDAALADVGGPGLPPGGWSAACDGGFIARDFGLPVVVMGPGSVSSQAHRPDESVGIGELTIAARAYALAALRLLA